LVANDVSNAEHKHKVSAGFTEQSSLPECNYQKNVQDAADDDYKQVKKWLYTPEVCRSGTKLKMRWLTYPQIPC
jgi:hypothetical protein